LLLAGCDDRIEVTRNPSIPVSKGNSWAWRPLAAPREEDRRDERRPVISRDTIAPRDRRVERNPSGASDTARERVRIAIEQTLSSKGLRQVNDPREADFLVEYHMAVRKRDVTVQRGYPGVVCGPYGCWESWGWGAPYVGYENIRFREGTIIFDLVQQSSKRLAYRAVGQKPVDRNTFNQGEISGFVRHMLGKLKTNG
jgi:hypothetical protein